MHAILLSALPFAFCLLLSGCASKQTASRCIDPSRIDREGMCTDHWDPVCGCDGQTYSNQCYADHAGVTSTKPGECPADKLKTDEQELP